MTVWNQISDVWKFVGHVTSEPLRSVRTCETYHLEVCRRLVFRPADHRSSGWLRRSGGPLARPFCSHDFRNRGIVRGHHALGGPQASRQNAAEENDCSSTRRGRYLCLPEDNFDSRWKRARIFPANDERTETRAKRNQWGLVLSAKSDTNTFCHAKQKNISYSCVPFNKNNRSCWRLDFWRKDIFR